MLYLSIPPLWGWLGAGLALVALEVLLAPGSYLLWVGLAALVMALLSLGLTFSPAGELAMFGALALLSGLAGWRLYAARSRTEPASALHDPTVALVGKIFPLHSAIEQGIGQIRLNDTVWRVAGPSLEAGTLVRVTALDGSTLIVEPA